MATTERQVAEAHLKGLIEDLYDAGDRERLIGTLVDVFGQVSRENDQLRCSLLQMQQRLYGRKSEKVDPNQLRLALEQMRKEEFARQDAEAPAQDEQAPAQTPPKARKPHPGRAPLPPQLPREERRHQRPEAERGCEECGGVKEVIREERSERLEYVPGSFRVIEDVTEVYACRCGFSKPVAAEQPPRPIEGGLPEPGLLAQVVISKYRDHCPLHRQTKIYQRSGVTLSSNTLVDWVKVVAWWLKPLWEEINKRVLRSWVVQSDDTGLRVLDKDHEKGRRLGRIWANIGDGRYVVYHFTTNWRHEHPQRHLKGVAGYLQTDGYRGYDALCDGTEGKAIRVGCLMHARRYFYNAFKAGDHRATIPLDIFQRIYQVERDSKDEGETPAQRLARRQTYTIPLLLELEDWLDRHRGTEPPKTPLGKAVTYLDNHWGPLNVFVNDGRLEPDNGAVERALRGIAIGRKNWLFAGSAAGGERAAIISTVIESAVMHGIEPFAYVRDVLAKLSAGWPRGRLAELLPEQWRES